MAIEIKYTPWSTPLTQEELDDLIPWYISTQGQLNEWETINISKWLEWAYKARWDILTEIYCRKLHKKMFGETWKWAWEFRKTNKNIWSDSRYISIELRKTLDDVKFWIENNTFDIHEIAIRLHYRLVFVHPFPNWNWRFSRAMADMLVYKAKQKLLSWNFFWDLTNSNEIRNQYIQSLKKADLWDFSDLINLCKPR